MAKRKQKTYKSIERPYDNYLEREGHSDNPFDSNPTPTASSTPSSGSTGASGSGSTGSVEQAYVKNDGNLQDIWIKNFIRSENWKPKTQGFYLDGRTGKAQFMGVYISGELEVTSGGNTTLVASGSTAFAAGPTGSPTFTVTSAGHLTATSALIGGCLVTDSTIGTVDYVSGPLGYGWQVESNGKAEFQNVSVRGIIRTSVFEKDTISAVNGIVLVSSADVLDADMTSLNASTLKIKGDTTFSENEIIRIKDGTDDEWMMVTDASGAPYYVVSRDMATDYAADNNPAWKKGTAVVSMGVGDGDKTGFISLDSSSEYSPFIDIYGRNSTTYNDYTLHARTGWLKGITDTDVGLNATDTWGIYTDNAYIKGVIVADTGKIGGTSGWTISAGLMTSVNGANTTNVASGGTYAFEAGTTGSPQFKVSHAGEMTATSGTFSGSLSAVTGTLGALTITSGGNIKYGKTAYSDDTNAGFWLGDDSGTAKFNMGASATKYLHYDGSNLTMLGGTITGGIIQTDTADYRVRMNGSNDRLEFLSGETVRSAIYVGSGEDLVLSATDDIFMYASGSKACRFGTGGFFRNKSSYDIGASDERFDNLYVEYVDSGGDVRCRGTFKSSDGTSGATTTFTHSYNIYSYWTGSWTDIMQQRRTMTVKDGLITSESGSTTNTVLAHVWNG